MDSSKTELPMDDPFKTDANTVSNPTEKNKPEGL